MTDLKKTPVIIGNWKMYKTIEESTDFIKELIPLVQESTSQIYLAVPFTLIKPVADAANDSSIIIGAQNMNDAEEGAFTGEIAGRMLKDAGAKFVILGHSERRHIFQETDSFINKKVKRALTDGLQPVLCIGETFDEREASKTEEVLEKQLGASLEGITEEQMTSLIIGYEPVWAVGAGFPATPEVAEESISICRKYIEKNWGKKAAKAISIVYGGAVRPENCKLFLDQPNVNGLLVGGASLSADTFSKIINYHEELVR
jgi:triosephosphate isomerase